MNGRRRTGSAGRERRGSDMSPARHDGERWCCCACGQGFLTLDGAPTRCCADGAPAGKADGEHELQRGSTDGGDSEHWRRRGREQGGSERGSSGRERERARRPIYRGRRGRERSTRGGNGGRRDGIHGEGELRGGKTAPWNSNNVGRNRRSRRLCSLARVAARLGLAASVSNAQGQGAAVAASGSGLAARVAAPVPGATELHGVQGSRASGKERRVGPGRVGPLGRGRVLAWSRGRRGGSNGAVGWAEDASSLYIQ
jgi:hypothetical protein